jgi:hypothetical protein
MAFLPAVYFNDHWSDPVLQNSLNPKITEMIYFVKQDFDKFYLEKVLKTNCVAPHDTLQMDFEHKYALDIKGNFSPENNRVVKLLTKSGYDIVPPESADYMVKLYYDRTGIFPLPDLLPKKTFLFAIYDIKTKSAVRKGIFPIINNNKLDLLKHAFKIAD